MKFWRRFSAQNYLETASINVAGFKKELLSQGIILYYVKNNTKIVSYLNKQFVKI